MNNPEKTTNPETAATNAPETILSALPDFEHYRELESKRAIFEAIDRDDEVTDMCKHGLIGIIAGIKQATVFTVDAEIGEEDSKTAHTDAAIDALGLKYTRTIEPSDYDPNYLEIDYRVAKTDADVQRLNDLFRQSWTEDQTGAATRELGKMFGFPETATDFYIERNQRGFDPEHEFYVQPKKYYGYIHSPEHGEEEYQQYEQKMNRLFQEYCSLSAADAKVMANAE